MSVARFLANQRPRPNPPGGAWRAERRLAESPHWQPASAPAEEDVVRDDIAAPIVPYALGELVRLVDPDGLTRAFWVATTRGLADAGVAPRTLGPRDPRDSGADWEAAWEGDAVDPEAMVRASGAVDRGRLALVACAAVDLAAEPCAEAHPDAARRAVAAAATVRRVAETGAWPPTGRDVRALEAAAADMRALAAEEFPESEGDEVPRCLAEAAGFAVQVLYMVASPESHAANALLEASLALPSAQRPTDRVRLRPFGPIVRRWIPLAVMLLARAGEPTPPGLQL